MAVIRRRRSSKAEINVIVTSLDADGVFDGWVGVVVDDFEVWEFVFEN